MIAKKLLKRLLQIRFCKKFLGSSFFGDAVDTDIHEESKNELTTKFAAKGRICNGLINIFFKLPQEVRYILIGGWNTFFSLSLFIGTYTLLQKFLHYMVVAVICHIFSVMQSFVTFKILVFRTHGNWLKEYIKINITYVGALLCNLALLYLFCTIYKFDPRAASIINAVIIAFLSYFLHKFFTFKTIKS